MAVEELGEQVAQLSADQIGAVAVAASAATGTAGRPISLLNRAQADEALTLFAAQRLRRNGPVRDHAEQLLVESARLDQVTGMPAGK